MLVLNSCDHPAHVTRVLMYFDFNVWDLSTSPCAWDTVPCTSHYFIYLGLHFDHCDISVFWYPWIYGFCFGPCLCKVIVILNHLDRLPSPSFIYGYLPALWQATSLHPSIPTYHSVGLSIWRPNDALTYRKTSNISRTLVGNKIVDNSDVVGASPVGAAPTTSSFST